MIYKKFGNCLFADNTLAIQVAMTNSEAMVTEEPVFQEYTNLAHEIIRDYEGYTAKVDVKLQNIFTTKDNILTGERDYVDFAIFLGLLEKIIEDNETIYIKPYNDPTSVTQTITQTEIDNNTAFLVSLDTDMSIQNFVDYLMEAGQYIDLTFKSLALVDLPIVTVGYGASGYGEDGYGHQEDLS